MIKVLFLGWIRELVGVSSVNLKLEYDTVSDLRDAFAQKNECWKIALESGKLLAAVNYTLVSMNYRLKPGDEVAFFPPITGG